MPAEEVFIVNQPKIDEIFDKLRKAGHGAVIKFDASNSGQSIEGIIFEPGTQRPSGYESGIFVSVPSDEKLIYYLDPEASREEGRLVIKLIELKPKKPAPEVGPEELLKDFEHLRQAPDVKRGGGAAGEACSKHKGIV